jgi:hypothetical protein
MVGLYGQTARGGLAETLMESAEVFFGQATHVYRPKRGRSQRTTQRPPFDGLTAGSCLR